MLHRYRLAAFVAASLTGLLVACNRQSTEPSEPPTPTVRLDKKVGKHPAPAGPEQGGQPPAEIVAPQPTSPTPTNLVSIAPTSKEPLDVRLQKKFDAQLQEYQAAKDPAKRSDIAWEIAMMGDSGVPKYEVAKVLGNLFASESDPDVKQDILDHLELLGDSAAFEEVVRGVDANQPAEIRVAAISVMESLEDARAVPILEKLLQDKNADVREAAKSALDSLNSQ
jgi:hypothetical protein